LQELLDSNAELGCAVCILLVRTVDQAPLVARRPRVAIAVKIFLSITDTQNSVFFLMYNFISVHFHAMAAIPNGISYDQLTHTRVPSKELRERLGLDDIISVLQPNILRWYEHMLQRKDNNWVKKCMEYEVEGVRPRGSPESTSIGERLCKKTAKNVN